MKIALWIIAICSLIRIIQNGIQLSMLLGEREFRKSLNNEFIDSLRKDNKEWVEDLLKDFLNEKYEEDKRQMESDCAWK